ncbi:MAG: hypothetical protein ACK5C3_03835 [bacterium]|jgi:hypothetical protein
MHPEISEFSFGYALTESLVAATGRRIRAAPVFPSLIDEGRPGGGYDAQIPFAGYPLFLQFKLSHRMVRDSAAEVKAGVLQKPFYRFHLRPARHSQQHQLLLDLEATGAAVFYAAPAFHKLSELDAAYIARKVVERSVFFRPSQIGSLPDDEDHHIAFKPNGPAYFCSKAPRLIRESRVGSEELLKELLESRSATNGEEPTIEKMESLANELQKLVHAMYPGLSLLSGSNLETFRQRNPLSRIAYLSYTYLESSVIWVSPPSRSDA